MSNASRCNGDGGGAGTPGVAAGTPGAGAGGKCAAAASSNATAVVSKTDNGRVVNGNNGSGGGGYVNQTLGDNHEMVVTTSKIAGRGNQMVLTVANNQAHSQPPSQSELSTVQEGSQSNEAELEVLKNKTLENESVILRKENDKAHQELARMQKELACMQHELARMQKEMSLLRQENIACHRKIEELTKDKYQSLEVLPSTPVSSTCSSGLGDLSSVDPNDPQDVKPKRRRNRQTAMKQPNADAIEPSHIKRQRTRSRSTRAKSDDLNKPDGKVQELSLITTDNAYYTCVGNYDPVKDDPVPENTNSNLEIPSWRVKTYSSWYSMEGTENMSDDIFENRHSSLELCERRRKRWDMQRLRELRRIEYLKEGRNKHHLQKCIEPIDDNQEVVTLLPNPANIKAIEVTDKLPVSAFGCNLHIPKSSEPFTFYHSKWCHNGSKPPSDPQTNVQEHCSSAGNQFFENT